MKRCRGTEVQRCRGAEVQVQWYRGEEMQICRGVGAEVQRYRGGTEVQRYRGTEVQRYSTLSLLMSSPWNSNSSISNTRVASPGI